MCYWLSFVEMRIVNATALLSLSALVGFFAFVFLSLRLHVFAYFLRSRPDVTYRVDGTSSLK